MKKGNVTATSLIFSYWYAVRMVFVAISLYFMGIAFHSWDGYKYYGTFPDFLSGIAVVYILWGIVACTLGLLIWLLSGMLESGLRLLGIKARIEHVLMFAGILLFLVVLVWQGKEYVKPAVKLIRHTGLFVLVLSAASLSLTILLRKKAVSYVEVVQERITPLVWLFGTLLILSFPLVLFHIIDNHISGGYEDMASETRGPSSADKKPPNIILVTFDALTARNMSVYGYGRETTPFISEWAKSSSIFTMAEAESNYTSPTTASMMTGKRVWTHQLYAPHGYSVLNADTENLPLLLKNNGYYNIALIQNSFASVDTLGIARNFDIAPSVIEYMDPSSIVNFAVKKFFQVFGSKYHRYNWLFQTAFLEHVFYRKIPLEVRLTEYPPEKVFDNFLKIMSNNPPEPFFAWIHVFPPHDPYLPPEPYMGMFDPSQKLRTEKSQWLTPDWNTARARYDEFVRYCDKEFENFMHTLSKYDKDIVIALSSDHGHGFEHNYRGHGGPDLYEPLTNIPLIIKEPGQAETMVIDDVVEQIDIAPTILELANVPVPAWMEGKSLLPLMRGKELVSVPALSMQLEGTPRGNKIVNGTIAVWDGDYKLVHYLKDNKSLLFNLKEDPGELRNLVRQKPEIARSLLGYIKANLQKANRSNGNNITSGLDH